MSKKKSIKQRYYRFECNFCNKDDPCILKMKDEPSDPSYCPFGRMSIPNWMEVYK